MMMIAPNRISITPVAIRRPRPACTGVAPPVMSSRTPEMMTMQAKPSVSPSQVSPVRVNTRIPNARKMIPSVSEAHQFLIAPEYRLTS